MNAFPPAPPAVIALATGSVAPMATSSAIAVPRPGPLDFLPRRDPGTALLLSLAVNGGGQFYNGETTKGWWLLSPLALYPVAWAADYGLQSGYARTGWLVLYLGTKAYSCWDAYQVAARQRREATK